MYISTYIQCVGRFSRIMGISDALLPGDDYCVLPISMVVVCMHSKEINITEYWPFGENLDLVYLLAIW